MPTHENVFDIFELAELIFLELSLRDLMCGAQQTSRQWNAIIKSSSRLQQALISEPVRFERLKLPSHNHTSDGGDANPADDTVRVPIIDHPLIGEIWEWNMDAMRYPEASWRRALVTQPPLKKLKVILCGHHPLQPSEMIAKGPGVTLGELLATDEELLHFNSIFNPGWGSKGASYGLAYPYTCYDLRELLAR